MGAVAETVPPYAVGKYYEYVMRWLPHGPDIHAAVALDCATMRQWTRHICTVRGPRMIHDVHDRTVDGTGHAVRHDVRMRSMVLGTRLYHSAVRR